MKNLGRRGVVAPGAAVAFSPAVHAQGSWPERPVKVVVGFPAGGPTDIVKAKAKALGMEMAQSAPASAKKFYEDRIAMWGPIVKASGAKVE